jgi:hypothetical protein
MDVFTQKRFMLAVIVTLVILNIGTMTLVLLRETRRPDLPPPHHRPSHDGPGSASMLKKELALSDEQFERYLELRERHRDKAGRIRDEMDLLRRQMFRQLFETEPDTVEVARIIQILAEKGEMLERVTFAHLRDLRDLCGEGQQEKLQRLLDEFSRATGKPPQRPGDRLPHKENPPGRF